MPSLLSMKRLEMIVKTGNLQQECMIHEGMWGCIDVRRLDI
jgi:hypothetical protein